MSVLAVDLVGGGLRLFVKRVDDDDDLDPLNSTNCVYSS